MIYSDVDIISAMRLRAGDNWIRVEPWDWTQLQPASVDLKLGTNFVCFEPVDFIDMRDRLVPSYPVNVGADPDAFFELAPKQLVLGTTIERIELGPRVCASIEGKSSLGRMGLAVHVTAGFVDPGFRGQITLELFNLSASPIRLRPGLAVCQIAFRECFTRALRPYGSPGLGSRYQDQAGAVPVKP